jgi:hypothetical protein
MKRVLAVLSLALTMFILSTPTRVRADESAALANAVAAEQILVITTDDRFYTLSPHDAGKIDPLTGLPFARNESEEFAAAVGMNFMLRNHHQLKLLRYTATAFPILERSIIGVGISCWKTAPIRF